MDRRLIVEHHVNMTFSNPDGKCVLFIGDPSPLLPWIEKIALVKPRAIALLSHPSNVLTSAMLQMAQHALPGCMFIHRASSDIKDADNVRLELSSITEKMGKDFDVLVISSPFDASLASRTPGVPFTNTWVHDTMQEIKPFAAAAPTVALLASNPAQLRPPVTTTLPLTSTLPARLYPLFATDTDRFLASLQAKNPEWTVCTVHLGACEPGVPAGDMNVAVRGLVMREGCQELKGAHLWLLLGEQTLARWVKFDREGRKIGEGDLQ